MAARLVDTGASVEVRENSTLDGAPLHAWVDALRAVDAQGRPRADLFAFALKDPADLARFTARKRVTLVTPG